VREVLRVGDITRVPEAPPHIRGVTSVRGRILPVVELRTRLGLPHLGEPGCGPASSWSRHTAVCSACWSTP
jgi:chemotaxis signal transduction protein